MLYQVINETHISKLAELYVETYNAPPWNDQWTLRLAMQKLDEMINCRDSFGLIACEDESNILGMIVGSSEIYYNCKQFFIKDFFVIPSMQGHGIGTALMAEFESRLKNKGIDKTYLFTSRGDKTENYYQKCGYRSWNNMVIMGKSICK